MAPCRSPSTVEELKAILSQPLALKIPLAPQFYQAYSTCPHISHLFQASSTQVSLFSSQCHTALIARLPPAQSGENCFISFYDNLFTSIIASLAPIIIKRTTVDDQGTSSNARIPSKATKLRPDLLFYLNSALCFKAEEKLHGSLDAPFNELVQKFGWNSAAFGALPFVLCYAAAGPLVQLGALLPSSKLELVSSVLDLT